MEEEEGKIMEMWHNLTQAIDMFYIVSCDELKGVKAIVHFTGLKLLAKV